MDRRIRELINQAHLTFVKKDRKQLSSFLKKIIGPWLCCRWDPSRDVSRLAQESFMVRIESWNFFKIFFYSYYFLLKLMAKR